MIDIGKTLGKCCNESFEIKFDTTRNTSKKLKQIELKTLLKHLATSSIRQHDYRFTFLRTVNPWLIAKCHEPSQVKAFCLNFFFRENFPLCKRCKCTKMTRLSLTYLPVTSSPTSSTSQVSNAVSRTTQNNFHFSWIKKHLEMSHSIFNKTFSFPLVS